MLKKVSNPEKYKLRHSATSLIITLVGLFVIVYLMVKVNPSYQTWHRMFEKVGFKRAYMFKSTCLDRQCMTFEKLVSAQVLHHIIRKHRNLPRNEFEGYNRVLLISW